MALNSLHETWSPPVRGAPEIQVRAYRLMMQILHASAARLPDVLVDPFSEKADRILDAAIATSSKLAEDQSLRNAAIDLLQQRILGVHKNAPIRLSLPPQTQHCPLSTSFGARLEMLDRFVDALRAFVIEKRPHSSSKKWGNSDPTADRVLDAFPAAGLLIAMLVTRMGQTSLQVLARVLESIESPLTIAGRWAWVDITLPEHLAGTSQLRRIFFDPVTIGAWRVARAAVGLPKPAGNCSGTATYRHYATLANQCFDALLIRMGWVDHEGGGISLQGLCDAKADWIRVNAMPLLATYSIGGVASSSLTEDTWLRTLGYEPYDLGTETPPSVPDGTLDAGESTDALPVPSIEDQLASGDLEERGLLSELRSIMDQPLTAWDEPLRALSERLDARDGSKTTAGMAVRWLRHLATATTAKGQRLAAGTIRNKRGLLVNRLITLLPESLTSLDEDELSDSYREVIDSGTSTQQKARIATELRRFDRFIRSEIGLSLPNVSITGFNGGSYQVSSRIITESEFKAVLAKTQDGSVVFANARQALEARVFVILAYRLGMRRGEILGLQAGDSRRGLRSILHVRPNESRTLKTNNALRALAVDALSTFERDQLAELCDGKASRDYLFFDRPPSTKDLEGAAVIRRINDLLYRVTGDRRLHPHNLRHSFPTQLALGMFGKDIGLATHPYAEPWMRRTIRAGERFERLVCGSLHRKGGRGSAMALAMGHGSETTSYQHYVHSLDLLLFFSCVGYLYPETFGTHPVRDKFRVGEVELLTAMLGLHTTTRLKTDDISALLADIAKHSPGRMRMVDQRCTRILQRGNASGSHPLMLLDELKAIPGADGWPGYPDLQSEVDTASATLFLINGALRNSPEAMERLLTIWASQAKSADGLAAVFTPFEAAAFLDLWKQVLPDNPPEVLHRWTSKDQRQHKDWLTPRQFPKALAGGIGRFLIRLADPRRDSSAETQRAQRTVGWTIAVVLHALRTS